MATMGDWVGLMRRLGEDFAKRSASHDEDDSFVAENYAALDLELDTRTLAELDRIFPAPGGPRPLEML